MKKLKTLTDYLEKYYFVRKLLCLTKDQLQSKNLRIILKQEKRQFFLIRITLVMHGSFLEKKINKLF